MSSSMTLARPVLRQSRASLRMAGRRFESNTTAKATEAAKDAASKASASAAEYASKAQEGLSRVTAAAGPALSGAAKGLASSLGKVGGRTGKVVGFVEKQLPGAIYYSKVGAELAKIVFRGQKMSPPSVQTMQSYWQNAWQMVKNPTSLIQTANQTAAKAQSSASIVEQVRNINRAHVIAGGVIFAECLGFFTVGEMIGRFKIIGYHGESAGAHH